MPLVTDKEAFERRMFSVESEKNRLYERLTGIEDDLAKRKYSERPQLLENNIAHLSSQHLPQPPKPSGESHDTTMR